MPVNRSLSWRAIRNRAALFDLTGRKFGRWTVISQAKAKLKTRGGAWWHCRCDCGTEDAIESKKLRNGRSRSCGCLKQELQSDYLATQLAGKRFGKWTVLRRGPNSSHRGARWLCKCECGTERSVSAGALQNGRSKSCGCIFQSEERRRASRERTTKHGAAMNGTTQEYRSWAGMINRCTNPNNQAFHHYGGRGITVCDRWRQDFAAFLADMGHRPTPAHSIDRINVNGNYEPANCQWATRLEQAQNRRGRINQFSTAELIAELRRRDHAPKRG